MCVSASYDFVRLMCNNSHASLATTHLVCCSLLRRLQAR